MPESLEACWKSSLVKDRVWINLQNKISSITTVLNYTQNEEGQKKKIGGGNILEYILLNSTALKRNCLKDTVAFNEINQQINQSTIQSINQSTKQPIKQLVNQY